MDATFIPTTQLPFLVLRAVVVYVFLLAALRLAGRREMGQMTSFDLVLLLLISNAVQNSINAGDNSLTGGLVSAVVLVGINWMAGYAAYRWRWAERLLQGRPRRVVTGGKVHFGAMRKELLTVAELRSALRKQGVARIGECASVDLEPDGTLSVLRVDVPQRSPEELAHPIPSLRTWGSDRGCDEADAGRS
jgi:uncharacterized membrane protein YcaP (DUF421 family)